MEQQEIDKHFTTLFNLYPSTNVMVHGDSLTFYKIPFNQNNRVQDELNALIMEHNLPLVAKSNESGNGLFSDTVFVEVKK